MKRTEPQSLREVLEEALRETEMHDELLLQRAINIWPAIVGSKLANSTGRPFFSRGVMYVAVHNPSLRHELTMMRSSIANAINSTLKSTVVNEIRFIGINNTAK